MSALPLAHAGATLAMTGLIWFVQAVHYPLFRFAETGDFPAFERAHQTRTTWLVTPLMSIELVTAVALLGSSAEADRTLAAVGLALLALIWASTAAVQRPLHRRLLRGFDAQLADLLVRSNWVRTVAWTARSVVALRLVAP